MNSNTLTFEDSLNLLGFTNREPITIQKINSNFRKLVKKFHPSGNDFTGETRDMAKMTEAKQILVDIILKGGTGVIEEIKDFNYWVRLINKKLESGCPKRSIVLDFGLDLISSISIEICHDIRSLDMQLFYSDYEEYLTEHKDFQLELSRISFICGLLDIKTDKWFNIIGEAYITHYMQYFIKTDFTDNHLADNILNMFEEFGIIEPESFIDKCLNSDVYIGNADRVLSVFNIVLLKIKSNNDDTQLNLNFHRND